MKRDLKQKSIAAVAWSGIDIFSRQGVQFVVSIFLARLLTPDEFGLLAIVMLFTVLASVFVDGGFSGALIQKKSLTQEETSSVFYFNLAVGLVVALLICGISPWIASFYGTPILKPLTCFMALNLFLGAFGSVHFTILQRELDFRTQLRISIAATALSGTVAILLAWKGWGVWSLAMQTVLSTAISTVLVWCWRSWRPGLVFRVSALRNLFRFGSFLFLSGILDAFYTRIYALLIGKLYSVRELGYYTRADSTQKLPSNVLSSIVDRIAFPAFSTAADDKAMLYRGMRKALSGLMMINIPLMLGLLAASRPLVLTLFGEKWVSCVPYLQVLSLAGFFWPLHVINLSLLKALGRSDLFFRLELIKKLLGFSTILIAANISVLTMAWSQVLLSAVCFFINAYYTGVLIGYPAKHQVRDVLPFLLASGIMLGFIWPLGLLSSVPVGLCLVLQVITGAAIYIGICIILKNPSFMEMRHQTKLWLLRIKPCVGT